MEYWKKILVFTNATWWLEDDCIYVKDPGVKIIKATQPSEEFVDFMKHLGIPDESGTAAPAEFASRLTYLAFGKQEDRYVERILGYGHASILNDLYVTFLLVTSVETQLEFFAHTEHKASRLTTSATKAQNTPVFRLQGDDTDMLEQKKILRTHMNTMRAAETERDNHDLKPLCTEFTNMLHPGCKCVAYQYTMSLKDFIKMTASRTQVRGNETEVREVAAMMREQLKEKYPFAFN